MSGPSQRSLAASFRREGRGLHSGEGVAAEVRPGQPGSGIRFRRLDLPGRPTVSARVDRVSGVEWETVLEEGEASVRTVEHLLAALASHRIDNAEILLDGPEPPALDGSAAPWCSGIREAGTVEQGEPARLLEVEEPVRLREGESSYTVLPYDGFRVSAEIGFEHPTIGTQFASAVADGDGFCDEVAPARTFGLEEWREPLRERGLALGASYENTIVLTAEGLSERSELRFPDEFVRHKILDLVGDLALVGARIRGHVIAEKPGHRGNVALARRLSGDPGAGASDAAPSTARPVAAGSGGATGGNPAGGGEPYLEIHEILEYMPHRYPFLMVDRVLSFEAGERIVGLKNVTINEPFFQGHFPEHPIMPGVLVIEAMAQAGGMLLMNEFEDPESKVVYLMSLDDVKFRRPVIPGDALVFELEMVQLRGRVCRMQGTGRVDGNVVAEATFLARVMDR